MNSIQKYFLLLFILLCFNDKGFCQDSIIDIGIQYSDPKSLLWKIADSIVFKIGTNSSRDYKYKTKYDIIEKFHVRITDLTDVFKGFQYPIFRDEKTIVMFSNQIPHDFNSGKWGEIVIQKCNISKNEIDLDLVIWERLPDKIGIKHSNWCSQFLFSYDSDNNLKLLKTNCNEND